VNSNAVSTARFRLGIIVTTPNALSQLSQEEMLRAIQRHQAGDWGDLSPHDRIANESAQSNGSRIWSVYQSTLGVKFWVITEADRSVTTILMPEDY
jgi:hypothetical protein